MEKREGQHSPGVYNSNAIMVHLVKRYAPTSDWLPDNPVTAAAVQRWLSIAAGEVCYGPAMARGALQWNMPGDPVLAAEIAGRLLGFMEQHLSDRDWLAASLRTLHTSRTSGTATLRRNRSGQPGVRWDDRAAGQGNLRRSGGGDMADDEIFTAATGQGLVVSTGILGDLVLPEGTFDPDRADEIRELAAQAAVYATQARGPGTLRAYRSAWRQYDAWCVRLGLPALSADPRLVGMYLTAAAERLAVATLQVHLAAIVTAHRLVGLSLDPGHPSIALLLDGIRRRRGTRPARQATPITPAMLARMVRAQPATPLGLRNRAILLAGFGGALRRSEIVGLDVGDLEFVEGRGVVLTVRRSKTDQHGAGQAVAVWRSDDPDLCAPTALRRWLEHRDARHSDDPLFVGLRAGGVMTATRLSDKAVVRLVRDTAEAVGDGDPGLMERTFGSLAVGATRSYSGHSLRAGLATAAAEAEAQLHDVMRQTRHKSVEVARRYMRSADLWRNNVTEKVMRRT